MKDYSKTHSFNVDSGDCEAAFCYKNRETGKDTPCSEGDSNGCSSTIGQFIEKHNLGFECKRVYNRPDGLMGDSYGMRHFRVKVVRPAQGNINDQGKTRQMSVYFSQGSGHTADPTLADVLDCLASDASGYEAAQGLLHDVNGFENWADEYGYDTDSRKAEKTYKAIKRQAEQLKRTLGQAAYDELLYNTERA